MALIEGLPDSVVVTQCREAIKCEGINAKIRFVKHGQYSEYLAVNLMLIYTQALEKRQREWLEKVKAWGFTYNPAVIIPASIRAEIEQMAGETP